MEPKIVTKPAFTVVGMLIHTRPMSQEIPALWGQFGPRMGEAQHLADPGASYGLMGRYDQVGMFDYMAGESVLEVSDLPTGMTHWDVAASTYAVFETTLPAIGETFGHIYNTWLPASGYQPAAAPVFERYGETFDPTDPTSTLSIYIPIETKA